MNLRLTLRRIVPVLAVVAAVAVSLVLLVAAGLGAGGDHSRDRAPTATAQRVDRVPGLPGQATGLPDPAALNEPMLVVQGYVESFNHGDTAAALAALGPDAVHTHQVMEQLAGDRNVTPHISPEAQKVYQFAGEHGIDPNAIIAGLVRGGAAVETAPPITPQLTLTDPTVEGDTLTAHFSLASPEFPGGVQRVIGTTTAVVRNQKIVLLNMDWDTTDPQTATVLSASNQR